MDKINMLNPTEVQETVIVDPVTPRKESHVRTLEAGSQTRDYSKSRKDDVSRNISYDAFSRRGKCV